MEEIKIVLASKNKGKIAELRALLSEYLDVPFSVLSLDDIGFDGDIVENGTTFEENAIIKASVPASLGYIGVADDSGLVVDALGGAPGIYSARYSGEGANDEKNNAKLLSELCGVDKKDRTARFYCAVACVFPNGEKFTVNGACEGIILDGAQGTGGFGYDPLFFYEPAGVTFGELPAAEKNKVSHRSIAMKKFAKELTERIK